MPLPKAYQPEDGYTHQILTRNPQYDREWEHLDYATSRQDMYYLAGEYNLAYRGTGQEIRVIPLPQKYWPKKEKAAEVN